MESGAIRCNDANNLFTTDQCQRWCIGPSWADTGPSGINPIQAQILLFWSWLGKSCRSELRRDLQQALKPFSSCSTWDTARLCPMKAGAGVKLNYDFSDLKYKHGLLSEGRPRGWIDCWRYPSLHNHLIMWQFKPAKSRSCPEAGKHTWDAVVPIQSHRQKVIPSPFCNTLILLRAWRSWC